MMLGGRAAENLTFGRVTTGAQNDLEKVRQQAYAQVRVYGMSTTIGPISFQPQNDKDTKPYSKHLGNLFDSEARLLVQQAYQTTEQLLNDNKDKLELVRTLMKLM